MLAETTMKAMLVNMLSRKPLLTICSQMFVQIKRLQINFFSTLQKHIKSVFPLISTRREHNFEFSTYKTKANKKYCWLKKKVEMIICATVFIMFLCWKICSNTFDNTRCVNICLAQFNVETDELTNFNVVLPGDMWHSFIELLNIPVQNARNFIHIHCVTQ